MFGRLNTRFARAKRVSDDAPQLRARKELSPCAHPLCFPFSCKSLRGLCIFALVPGSVLVTANEPFLNKPSSKWTEAEALQVLNDSPWAHTTTTTTQDTPCDYEHPAYPGLFPEEMAQILNQRVFDTTFFVNSTDLFDGTETVIHTPARVDEPTPATLP